MKHNDYVRKQKDKMKSSNTNEINESTHVETYIINFQHN